MSIVVKLRIFHQPPTLHNSQHKATIRFECPGKDPLTHTSIFDFIVTEQESNDIRWYLEEYPADLSPPNPELADMAEQSLRNVGERLFQAVFHDENNIPWSKWANIETQLPDCDIEVCSHLKLGWSIPWEQIRNPSTGTFLALTAKSFIRTHADPRLSPPDPLPTPDEVRILLVIARPQGTQDIGFRSLARRLLGILDGRGNFRLELLRPPTFPALAKRLRQAKKEEKPFHILHFDGHGTTQDLAKLLAHPASLEASHAALLGLNSNHLAFGTSLYPHKPQSRQRGYLLFENPDHPANIRFVDGEELGKLLRETQTHLTVLNTGFSIHVAKSEKITPDAKHQTIASQNTSALESLAYEVMNTGGGGILAMRYNIWVTTAARYIADLYDHMASGESFAEAVSSGRKQLADDPMREIVDQVSLQDWVTPMAYAATSIQLFRPSTLGVVKPTLSTPLNHLPASPAHGFVGRDETLLELERAFQNGPVVLLHAYAGSGKTTAAVEFAQWFYKTGGMDGPVLFTSFERYLSLAHVVDEAGECFKSIVEPQFEWSARNAQERQTILLLVLQQIPMLWIWDNVEPIAGFPTGTQSAWTTEEQLALKQLLERLKTTRAKILLTSRREEKQWLSDLPIRVPVPPMPMPDRYAMAKALAKRQTGTPNINELWRPLLNFTQGNPLTLTVTIKHALRQGWISKEEILNFVQSLRAGKADFEDEESEGRSKSLGAALKYGFEAAFSEEEQKILSLLHFFQGVVHAEVLMLMVHPENEHAILELQTITRDDLLRLLQRAAEIGLLTDLNNGYFTIHPALPWFFLARFQYYFPTYKKQKICSMAFVTAIGRMINIINNKYIYGDRKKVYQLQIEESNLLHAFQLARHHDLHGQLIHVMAGLEILASHFSRWEEWKNRVAEAAPCFVDPLTERPKAGREEGWMLILTYRCNFAEQQRNWPESERLQRILLTRNQQQATPLLNTHVEDLTQNQKNIIRTFSFNMQQLGKILKQQNNPECLQITKQSYNLCLHIADQSAAAIAAYNLGDAYKDLPFPYQDLKKAEQWIRTSLNLYSKQDQLGLGLCYHKLSEIAITRFEQERSRETPNQTQCIDFLNEALTTAHQAINLLPAESVDYLSITHNHIGKIYSHIGQWDDAIKHYQLAIRYTEQAGNIFSAAGSRFNVALVLAQQKLFPKALLYANAALINFQTFGGQAATYIKNTENLIAAIQADMAKQPK
ncbi:MAG: tetratricopeptide repeat protein [Magnetococcus sp. YQC-5]